MLKINDLTKYYGKNRGCIDVSLEIQDGEVFGLIGPNGAGKSTIIKCIMGLIEKQQGMITFDEEVLDMNAKEVKQKIGYLPSEIHLYDDFTVKKMLEYSASFYTIDCREKCNSLCQRLQIDTSKKIGELSLGNLKKVGIVLALMHQPQLIIMDEATSGLDPLMQEEFFEILKEEKAQGHTIFFSTHILLEVKKICDRVGVIKEGKLIKVNEVNEFTSTQNKKITIISDEIGDLELNGKIISKSEDTLVLMYMDDINKLLRILSRINLKQLLIEEASIDEIFLHFYE